jgi:hypothetical protein
MLKALGKVITKGDEELRIYKKAPINFYNEGVITQCTKYLGICCHPFLHFLAFVFI